MCAQEHYFFNIVEKAGHANANKNMRKIKIVEKAGPAPYAMGWSGMVWGGPDLRLSLFVFGDRVALYFRFF